MALLLFLDNETDFLNWGDNFMIDGNKLWDDSITKDMVDINFDNKVIHTYANLPDNVYEALIATCKSYPNKIAIVDDNDKKYTYRELVNMVDEFSSYLYYIIGVRNTHRIGIMLYNSIEFCVAFISLNKLGAITVPFPSKYKKNEVLSLVNKSSIFAVICHEDFYDWFVENETKGLRIIKTVDSNRGYGLNHLVIEDYKETQVTGKLLDPAVIMFTSGTTTESKGAQLHNYNIMHAIVSYQRILQLNSNDISIIPIPIYHITGLVALLGLFVYIGGTLYLHKFFDSKRVLRSVSENEITFIHASPTIFSLLLKEQNDFPNLPSLKKIACGSSNMPIHKLKQIHNWLPQCEFHTVYGLTETSSPATIFPSDAGTSPYIGSSGVPIPGSIYKIIGENGNELPSGEIGEIVINGAMILCSYFRSDTKLLDNNGWLKTGDLGYFNDQNYLYVVDRIKDMINRGGEKIWSSDVENELYAISGIQEAAVVAVRDDVYGEVAGAVIVLSETSTLNANTIKEILHGKIATYKIPKHILFMDELPKTPNNKIDKKLIRELFNNIGGNRR